MPNNYPPDQLIDSGLYVQNTPVFDVNALFRDDSLSPEVKELLVRLYQQINNVSLALNLKETGQYLSEEFRTSSNWGPEPNDTNYTSTQMNENPLYRVKVDCGALPNAGTIQIPHNISITPSTVGTVNPYRFVIIQGGASNQDTATGGLMYIPLPYVTNIANGNIEVNVDATYVNITTAIDYSMYTQSSIIVWYLKY